MMTSLSNPKFRSLSADEIDEISGGGFFAAVAAAAGAAAPVVIPATVAVGVATWMVARESGRDKARRDNELGVCRVPNT